MVCSPVPSAPMTSIASSTPVGPLERSKAIRRPSGDHATLPSAPSSTRLGRVVVASTVYMPRHVDGTLQYDAGAAVVGAAFGGATRGRAVVVVVVGAPVVGA